MDHVSMFSWLFARPLFSLSSFYCWLFFFQRFCYGHMGGRSVRVEPDDSRKMDFCWFLNRMFLTPGYCRIYWGDREPRQASAFARSGRVVRNRERWLPTDSTECSCPWPRNAKAVFLRYVLTHQTKFVDFHPSGCVELIV